VRRRGRGQAGEDGRQAIGSKGHMLFLFAAHDKSRLESQKEEPGKSC